jgi:hypothetical protein
VAAEFTPQASEGDEAMTRREQKIQELIAGAVVVIAIISAVVLVVMF